MKKLLLTTAAMVLLVTGCVMNPVANFYQDQTQKMPLALQQRLLPPVNAEPRIIQTTPGDELMRTAHSLFQQGYILVGGSAFQGPPATQSEVVEQARKVGAEVVVVTSENLGTQQGVRPVINYQPGQTYTTTESGTVNASAYGTGGYASGFGTYSGSATTTSSGTFNTQYVPYQYTVYSSSAGFFRRIKPGIFGAQFKLLPDNLRESLQRNTGAFVDVVVQDTPAFKANILEGDVIIQIADKPVTTYKDLVADLQASAGQKVPIKLIRNGQTLDIDVQLNGNP